VSAHPRGITERRWGSVLRVRIPFNPAPIPELKTPPGRDRPASFMSGAASAASSAASGASGAPRRSPNPLKNPQSPGRRRPN